MNNIQRVKKFCENEHWSTSHGMRQLLNTISMIGRDKDETAFKLLLEYSRKSTSLSEFVCDNGTTTALLRSQWVDVWDEYVREFVLCQPENLFKMLRMAQIHPQMFQSAQDIVWNAVVELEEKDSAADGFMGEQQTLLCCIALAAVEVNDIQLYDKCIEHWRKFDRMHCPLHYNWDKQIEAAAMGCQSWVIERINHYTDNSQYLLEYIERVLPLGAASDVEELIKKSQRIPAHKYTSSTVCKLITNTPKLWTCENLQLVKNLFQTDQELNRRPTLLAKVISAAFHTHLYDGLDFAECLQICNMACTSQYFSLHLKDLAQISIKFNDFRMLQHLSENHGALYSSAFSEEAFVGLGDEVLDQLLFKVDHTTDVLISQSPLNSEQIDTFRQKLKLADAVGSSYILSGKRKL